MISLDLISSRPSKNRLLAYGSLALGATGMASHHAEAATVVDVNAATFDSTLSNFGTIGFAQRVDEVNGPKGDVTFSGTGVTVHQGLNSGAPIQQATEDVLSPDLDPTVAILYSGGTNPKGGAYLNSDNNWIYATGATDPDQRLWLQMEFGDGTGGGTIVTAIYPSFAGELPDAAAAASLVPEPSALALLSLGASGLLARRRRSVA